VIGVRAAGPALSAQAAGRDWAVREGAPAPWRGPARPEGRTALDLPSASGTNPRQFANRAGFLSESESYPAQFGHSHAHARPRASDSSSLTAKTRPARGAEDRGPGGADGDPAARWLDTSRVGGADSRRAELIDAARRVIRRRGFAKATVGEITREAGASVGLLNYQFASRDDVVAEAFAAAAREELLELEQIGRGHADLRAQLAAYLDLEAWEDRDSWRMWIDAWGEAMHTETLRSTLEEFDRGWRAVLTNVLADGDRQGCWRCPDAEDAAARLVAAMDGIGLHAMLHPEEIVAARAAAWARGLAERELDVTLPAAPPRAPFEQAPTPYEARIPIRGRDLDATGWVHPAVLLTYLGEAREAWLEARLGAALRLEVAHLSADFRHVPTRSDAEVIVRCALDGLGATSVRTREAIETVGGELVASAGVTATVRGADDEPRPLTDDEREALRS
jgi:AcrR family transcriptional regulator/acyl-CoA thioesterase FadM